jgi:hypothetical protein
VFIIPSMHIIPDDPVRGRWCRTCEEFRPINEFSTKLREYRCQKHSAAMQKKRRNKLFASDENRPALWRMWHHIYTDSRSTYVKDGWCLSQSDILALCEEKSITPSVVIRIAPKNPTKAVTKDNILIVSKGGRQLLTKLWKLTGDEALYTSMLEKQQVKEV